ncbi:RNA polymerase sigma factor [Cesiribacter andamanensis]|uniref:RNA polymerase sigma factor sigM n=1 Tax=Cesiribacter andamanensis AMV16 TaxID=1279009 RepID=M7N526_9BACT|nr:sigma-70 family RNA polymerase sigma factor [Cesiribacter andamanensis]EMR02402.1 RNA polymerase sigma factor sigM [Cesiribacter andamanensis AMV16]
MELEYFRTTVLPARNRLYRVALWMLKDSAEAEDALQEGMLRLWVYRQKLMLCSNVEAFAVRTVRNLCLDRLKSKQYKGRQGLEGLEYTDSGQASPHQQAEQEDHEAVIRRLMLGLPEQQQWLLQLREVEELSYEEIEEITGMQINAIRVALSRARKTLREQFLKVSSYEKLG